MADATHSSAAALPGLELFAAAWVERLLQHGGSICASPNGEMMVWLPANAPDKPNLDGFTDPRMRDDQRLWYDAAFTGRTRELSDLLKLVPGGRDAVLAHVRVYATADLGADGRMIA